MSQFYRNITLTFEDGTIRQDKIFTSASSDDIIDKYMDLEVFDEQSKTLIKVMKIKIAQNLDTQNILRIFIQLKDLKTI